MKKSIKVSLIIASLLLLSGLCLCAIGYAIGGPDAFIAESEDYETATAVFDGVDSFEIDGEAADVSIVYSTADEVKVIYPYSEKSGYNVECNNGKLTIEYEDNKHWYDNIGIDLISEDLIIVLEIPQKSYDSINISTASGDIGITERIDAGICALSTVSGELRADVVADELVASTTSGDIFLGADVQGLSIVSTTSGDMTIDGSFNDIKLSTTSGDISLNYLTADGIKVTSASGSVELIDAVVSGDISVDTVSGDVSLSLVDADNYTVSTTSGDVSGTILSSKLFDVDTTSGDAVTPYVDFAEGTFAIDTTSGDIYIELAE